MISQGEFKIPTHLVLSGFSDGFQVGVTDIDSTMTSCYLDDAFVFELLLVLLI
jgi:hypothetical protein